MPPSPSTVWRAAVRVLHASGRSRLRLAAPSQGHRFCQEYNFRSHRPACSHVIGSRDHHEYQTRRTFCVHTGTGRRSDDVSKIVRSPHPRIAVPEEPFAEFMFSAMKQYGHKTALVDFLSGRQWTFRQVMEDAVKVASGLTRLGLTKGDTLLLFTFNCPEYALVLLACTACGIIVSTANPVYTAEELKKQIELSGSQAVIVAQDLVSVLQNAKRLDHHIAHTLKGRQVVLGQARGYLPFSSLLEDDGKAFPDDVSIRAADDVAFLPYSSGTTGLPKGVMLTHTNITANIKQQLGLTVGAQGEGRLLGVLPMYHIYGLVVSLFTSLYEGNTMVILPRFHPKHFLSAIQQYKVEVVHLVPPLVLFMAKDSQVKDYDISSLNKVVCGAAPMGEGITKEFATRSNAILMQAYGLTESSPITHLDSPPIRMGTIGRVVSTSDAKVVSVETGELLGPGQTGELCVRGPQVMKGYFNNQQATNNTIIDGWLHTGDLVHYDEDGYFTITDRLKELIKYKGFQVAPAELEALLLTHPAVKDVAVVGVPDEEAGELPKAFVVPKPGADFNQKDVITFLHSKVAPYKKLRGGLTVLDSIPKTASGKILRRVLKQNLAK